MKIKTILLTFLTVVSSTSIKHWQSEILEHKFSSTTNIQFSAKGDFNIAFESEPYYYKDDANVAIFESLFFTKLWF